MKAQWPRLKRDWIGRRVQLLKDLQTVGGKVYRKGKIMVVQGYYRGLKLKGTGTGKRAGVITRVRPWQVELLPK